MFNGNILRDAIISAANNIANQKNAVDDLNVFPVPDGDTGTNMSMSIGNAARELARIEGKTVGEVAKVAASALLRGARGNSGVITSLLFRGFSKGFAGADEITPENIAAAQALGDNVWLSPNFSANTQETINLALDAGIGVSFWTVNTIEDAKMLYDMGVRYMETDILCN